MPCGVRSADVSTTSTYRAEIGIRRNMGYVGVVASDCSGCFSVKYS